MPTLTERQHAAYEALAEAGRECRASGARLCTRPAVVRIATETTYSTGVPVTHLITACARHGRETVAQPIRGVTTVHVHALPEEG